MNRALGRRQQGMLQALDHPSLHRPRGIWHRHVGWTYGTSLQTVQLLESLRVRGLVRWDPDLAAVEGTPSNETYRLTHEGDALITRFKALAVKH